MADDPDLGFWPGRNKVWKTRAERDKAYDTWIRDEGWRVEHQRRYLTNLTAGLAEPDIIRLVKAMLTRAEQLLDMGFPGAADQLLEFVPAVDADAFNAHYWGSPKQENPHD